MDQSNTREADDTLEIFLNPGSEKTISQETNLSNDDLSKHTATYTSQLEIMRFKARNDDRQEEFEGYWDDYKQLMWLRADRQWVVAKGTESEFYRERRVWESMWAGDQFPGLDPNRGDEIPPSQMQIDRVTSQRLRSLIPMHATDQPVLSIGSENTKSKANIAQGLKRGFDGWEENAPSDKDLNRKNKRGATIKR